MLSDFGRAQTMAGAVGNGRMHVEAESHRPFMHTRSLAEIPEETIEWLWPGRIPYGKLTCFAGHPGSAKSWMTFDIASRLSNGVGWPDIREPIEPGATVFIVAEDDAADTIKRRARLAGADLSLIHIEQGVTRTADGEPRYCCLDSDIGAIEDAVVRNNAKLLVIDPVSSFLGDVNSHRDSDVRSVLGPLVKMAARTECAVVNVHHFSKGGANAMALLRVMGSLAFVGVSRAAWLVYRDKKPRGEKDTFIMADIRASLVEDPTAISFQIIDEVLNWSAEPVDITADMLMARENKNPEEKSEADAAADWLMELLAVGAMPVKEIQEAARAEGHSWRTLERCKRSLGVNAKRVGEGRQRPWLWELESFAE